MKVRTVRSVWLFLFGLMFAAGKAAEGRTTGVEVFGGAMLPVRDFLGRNTVTGFGILWPCARRTRIGVHFVYADLPSRGEGDGILPGRLVLTPFLAFVRQEFSLGERWAVHVAGGGGIVFARLREDVITIPEVAISQRFPSRAALHFAGGFSYSPARNLKAFVRGGWILFRTTGTTTIRDMNFGVSEREFAADLSTFQAVGGLAVYF